MAPFSAQYEFAVLPQGLEAAFAVIVQPQGSVQLPDSSSASRLSLMSLAAHSLPLSRLFRRDSRHERRLRSYRNDATRIQFAVALIVVALNVPKIDSRCDPLGPKQRAHIVRKAWIVGDPPDIAFEMAD